MVLCDVAQSGRMPTNLYQCAQKKPRGAAIAINRIARASFSYEERRMS
jgi:hypothetical protein